MLAETVAEFFRDLGKEDPQLTERLVRYYTQGGVLDRPRREGREATYGYRQVLQLVVARRLAVEGWPLAKIADFTAGADQKALLDLIPYRVERATASPPPASGPVVAHTLEKLKLQNRLEEGLRLLGNGDAAVQSSELWEVAITPWCRLQIERGELAAMTPEMAETLGSVVTDRKSVV